MVQNQSAVGKGDVGQPRRRPVRLAGDSRPLAQLHDPASDSSNDRLTKAQHDSRIQIPILTRVEGEGALRIKLDNREVLDVQLSIYEPPRLFESLLRGRQLEEAPDITARICGICPVAYQITAVEALERALDINTSPEIQALRRLLYCGEWIESHVLHISLAARTRLFWLR